MEIRAITCFIDPTYSQDQFKIAKKFISIAQPAFNDAGYTVQSARLATVPFHRLLPSHKPGALADLAASLEQTALSSGYAYISLGPALADQPDSYDAIPEGLSTTQVAFFSGSLTSPGGEIALRTVHQCARVIQRASSLTPDGFTNMRFAALANVPAGSPFFPAAYHQGGPPSFAIATEAADLAVSAFTPAHSLKEARKNLVDAMEAHALAIEKLAGDIEHQTGVRFGGIDFSLAPFPEERRSLGTAMELLGVPRLGLHGSLAAAAILADTIEQAKLQRAGFSGLMLPVLEDTVLAQRVEDGSLNITDLLLYSAVCGTGLDTLPLPGDTTVGQLSAILLDLASLSSRLGKPLTGRLMPILGKKAGDLTGFDFTYFANSRVMPLHAGSLGNFLAGEESYVLKPRTKREILD